MGTVIAIIVLFAIGGVIYAIRQAYLKATHGGISGALERRVFNKGTYERQQVLTRTKWIYQTTITHGQLRDGVTQHIVGPTTSFPGLQIIVDNDDAIGFGYSALHLSLSGVSGALNDLAAGKYEFTAMLMPPKQIRGYPNPVVIFSFVTWKTADTVVRNIDEMGKLQDCVDHMMRALDPHVIVTTGPSGND